MPCSRADNSRHARVRTAGGWCCVCIGPIASQRRNPVVAVVLNVYIVHQRIWHSRRQICRNLNTQRQDVSNGTASDVSVKRVSYTQLKINRLPDRRRCNRRCAVVPVTRLGHKRLVRLQIPIGSWIIGRTCSCRCRKSGLNVLVVMNIGAWHIVHDGLT
ncbi:hypothetical protein D3C72_1424700 [compost metagenome]